jgi:hypothetical protein
MRLLFEQIGFKLTVVEINPLQILFGIKPPIYESSTIQSKTCYTTAEAICRFFTKDLGLKCQVVEIGCVNEGAEFCVFKCAFDRLEVCRIAFDEHDRDLIKMIAQDMNFDQLLEKGPVENRDELKYRLDTLKEYGVIDDHLRLTDHGKKCCEHLDEGDEDKDFEPPWKDVKDISSAVCVASSFAEAVKETANQRNKE